MIMEVGKHKIYKMVAHFEFKIWQATVELGKLVGIPVFLLPGRIILSQKGAAFCPHQTFNGLSKAHLFYRG
jgi:hypothetical protein